MAVWLASQFGWDRACQCVSSHMAALGCTHVLLLAQRTVVLHGTLVLQWRLQLRMLASVLQLENPSLEQTSGQHWCAMSCQCVVLVAPLGSTGTTSFEDVGRVL